MKQEQNKTINVAKILATIVASRDLIPTLENAVKKTKIPAVELDFSEVQFVSRSAAHALLLLKENLQRKFLHKKNISFIRANKSVEDMFRIVAANRAFPKSVAHKIEREKIDINSLAKSSLLG